VGWGMGRGVRSPAVTIVTYKVAPMLQCFDAVGWATGRASGL